MDMAQNRSLWRMWLTYAVLSCMPEMMTMMNPSFGGSLASSAGLSQ